MWEQNNASTAILVNLVDAVRYLILYQTMKDPEAQRTDNCLSPKKSLLLETKSKHSFVEVNRMAVMCLALRPGNSP
jgi:hypothetical protein